MAATKREPREQVTHRQDRSGIGTCLSRRDILVGGTLTGTFVAFAGAKSARADAPPENQPASAGDRFQFIKGDLKDQLLRPDLLQLGAAPIEGFPFDTSAAVIKRKNRLNRILMLRLDPQEMDDETRALSVEGILVYSALCTHRSCTIKSWMAEEQILRCHCHLSEFDPLSGGSVLSGPARRQLPMIPLGVDDEGFVIAMDGFTRKPGGAKT